jgi:hypothetical protein
MVTIRVAEAESRAILAGFRAVAAGFSDWATGLCANHVTEAIRLVLSVPHVLFSFLCIRPFS